MKTGARATPLDILLVEDNPVDVLVTQEALKQSKTAIRLHVVSNGAEAIAALRGEVPDAKAMRPGLILLDLNLPRKDGRQVLSEIKTDPELRHIPVVIVTGSQAEQDIRKSYQLGANCYVIKPADLDQFVAVIKAVNDFWSTTVTLPGDSGGQ